jgi:hypothetical protein
VVGLVAWGTRVGFDARERAREIEALYDEVRAARFEAETCRMELGRREAAFRRLDQRVDSLRDEVRRFEALDRRGVPRARYEAYLREVALYNRSVEAWESRVEMLRTAEEACRASVHHHNLLTDSLRSRLEAEGLASPAPS